MKFVLCVCELKKISKYNTNITENQFIQQNDYVIVSFGTIADLDLNIDNCFSCVGT